MPGYSRFNGFPPECVRFFEDLAENNSKQWFDENRSIYDNYVMAPARNFVIDMGERLRQIAPKINVDPRVNRSLFRINRDTRFSHDKRPYKTNLGIWFWEGKHKKMECPGFYFHLEPPHMMVGAGIYRFSKPIMDEYRNSVVHYKHGAELVKATSRLSKKGYTFSRKHYKRTPRGFDPDHKNAELLKYNGLYAGFETEIPAEFYRAGLVDFCFAKYNDMLLLHKWLLAMTNRV